MFSLERVQNHYIFGFFPDNVLLVPQHARVASYRNGKLAGLIKRELAGVIEVHRQDVEFGSFVDACSSSGYELLKSTVCNHPAGDIQRLLGANHVTCHRFHLEITREDFQDGSKGGDV